MKLSVTRFADRRYETHITRDDGATFHVQGVAHMFAIPHDLAHFAIEQALGLKRGFWGSVAAGAVFKTMHYTGGRRRPHAAERSRTLLKQNAARLSEAEVLVRLFNDAIEQGHAENSPVLLRERLAQRWSPPGKPRRTFSAAEIAATFAAWTEIRRKWDRLPGGGTLELVWDGPAGCVHRRRSGLNARNSAPRSLVRKANRN
jgi:hypothetical protein